MTNMLMTSYQAREGRTRRDWIGRVLVQGKVGIHCIRNLEVFFLSDDEYGAQKAGVLTKAKALNGTMPRNDFTGRYPAFWSGLAAIYDDDSSSLLRDLGYLGRSSGRPLSPWKSFAISFILIIVASRFLSTYLCTCWCHFSHVGLMYTRARWKSMDIPCCLYDCLPR